jgi:glycosyltransferase involved in cell wall biosynthesis
VDKRLHICVLSLHFAPIVGGAETQAEKHARRLQELGHEVTVITLRCDKDWPAQENYKGLPIIRIGGIYNRQGGLRIGRLGHFPIDMLVFLQLWQLSSQYDVIHLAQLSSIAGVAALIGKLKNIPVIIGIASAGPGKAQQEQDATLMADTFTQRHIDTSFLKVPYDDILVGDFTYLEKTAIGGKFIHKYIKNSDAYYQVLSTRSQADLLSQGIRADKIVKIANGVDTKLFCPHPSLPPDPTHPERSILCVSRLEFPKGIDVLLHAWGRMMNAPADWRAHLKPKLLIAGSGTLQAQMERIVTLLGIQDSVEFLGLQRDIPSLLQKAWGFVLPSKWEGMPNALLEAMSCAVPSIATRVSGSEDIIEDGVNGLLVEPEQPEQMAEALRRLIEDTELAQRLARAGHATILREYQLSHVTDQCLKFYYQILQQDQTEKSLVTTGMGEH